MSKCVLIVGASRGIGLGFAELFSSNGWEVHATARNTSGEKNLSGIQGNIFVHKMDVRFRGDIVRVAKRFEKKPIDILIHNAGVSGENMNKKDVLYINSVAPFNVVAQFLPLVLMSTEKKIALLTSQMGARSGGSTPSDVYGESKCALNDQFRKSEPTWRHRGATSLVFHPGWVRTDMGGPGASISISESVSGMYEVLQDLEPSESGSFLTWKGDIHPW